MSMMQLLLALFSVLKQCFLFTWLGHNISLFNTTKYKISCILKKHTIKYDEIMRYLSNLLRSLSCYGGIIEEALWLNIARNIRKGIL